MKKVSLFFIMLLAFSSVAGAQDIKGDLNYDGRVNITDVTALIGYLMSGTWPYEHAKECVDLGLPSGTLWATCNIGAIRPEEYGDHFAWGETAPKEVYSWETYKWGNGSDFMVTKYCTSDSYGSIDNKMELDPEDDAAYVNWGPSWRMPTIEQLQELVDNCTWDHTSRNDVSGYLLTGPNGHTIFLPDAGHRMDSVLYQVGSCSKFWSRTLYSVYSDCAYYLNVGSSGIWSNYTGRYIGMSVRAVRMMMKLSSEARALDLNGDLNGDSRVNISDVTTLINYLLTGIWPNNHEQEWIDLGLPSGTLWATCNIGANNPEECGDFFAWGETAPVDYYDWSTYRWCNGSENTMTKYCTDSTYGTVDGKIELDLEDDAAYVNWGPSWRMPTRAQQNELYNKCTWTWATMCGVYGYLVTGPNGSSIFLPAAGYRKNDSLLGPGSSASYWSCEISSIRSNEAHRLAFSYSTSGHFFIGGTYTKRYFGYNVRPVRASQD